MKFSEVIGHKVLKEQLARGIDARRVSHAQIFTGPAGYGALPLALAYAQYVNCTARQGGDSCGACPSCLKIAQLVHPDLHFVYPTNSVSKSGSQKPTSDYFLPQWRETVKATGGYFGEPEWYDTIEIENQQGIISRADADEVMRKLSFKSFEGNYKIVIVWLPEKMREEAANALLKILEEPWEKTLFLLVSQTPDTLLPTILSRVQQIAVPQIPEEEMAEWLTDVKELDSATAHKIVKLAGGNLLTAQALMEGEEDPRTQEQFELFKQLMRLSYNDKHMELIEWAETVAGIGREEQKRFLTYCVKMLRNSYMLSAGMKDISYLWGEEEEFCTKFAPFIGNHNIEALVREITLASQQVVRNGNPKLIFPHFALTVSKLIVRL